MSPRPQPASGRFLLRLEPGLHAALRAAARAEGVSLNEHCARKLALPCAGGRRAATDAVLRAAELLGTDLVGVAAYGSWARGEATGGSDVDLLIVIEDRLPLGRALYRSWDERPLGWEGRIVDPHFVHLPPEEETVAGLWAEAALDGVVLFERDHKLSARLARVRRDIASGRVVRRIAHGQPYWTLGEVA